MHPTEVDFMPSEFSELGAEASLDMSGIHSMEGAYD
jgi:hypothetical protein